jgi:DNA-binding HxlR family transcriptional regulator
VAPSRHCGGGGHAIQPALRPVGATPLVLREAFAGKRRFEDFQRGLAVPRAVLAKRLTRLVDDGLMVKQAYAERPVRYEYRLTG